VDFQTLVDVKDKKLILSIGILAVIGVGGYFLMKKTKKTKRFKEELKELADFCVKSGCSVKDDGNCDCSTQDSQSHNPKFIKIKEDCIKQGCIYYELEGDPICSCSA